MPDSSLRLAARMKTLAPSPMLKLAAEAARLRAEGRDIISLATGEPDFDTPEHIQAAAIAAMRAGDTHYTAADGTPALKQAIMRKFARENDLKFAQDQISVSSGAKQVIFNALAATVGEGDEVLVPVPYYPSYLEMTRMLGGTPVAIAGDEAQRLTAAALEAAITPASRWLILNAPGNPSGIAYSRDELAAFAGVLRRHPHLWVMADDIYEHLLFTGRFATLAEVAPDLGGRILTVNGVSKAYCMTGWRIGYGAGPAPLIRAMSTVQSQIISCPSSVSQAAAVAALDGPASVVDELRAAFDARRVCIVEALDRIEGVSCPLPDGAFYVLPDVSALIGRRRPDGRPVGNDADIAEWLIKDAGVIVVPGREFGAPGRFRISYAADTALLDEACRRIAASLGKLR
ncbi:MAG: pyridoxal phosphate-dependent aminotransferase [Aquamicrobium sp.]|uniref:pyridoxal phosphate-dependent aminotransferase n=1 Tax=Aquamicrobium sp. TaxID=1872579 RepID=UPI00349ECA53|nr:pyridoxal phosphate-dependent aminotransferase [Aquamicrobium sp.]